MQNRRITPQNLLITIFSFALITGLSAVIQDNIIGAGVSDTVKEIHRFIEGWNTFFSRLSAVTSLLGFKTLMLFLAVLIISSGLAAIGIPRGKVSFLAALLLCNLVWIAFKDSFNPGNIAYLGPILRANLTLCMPLILLNGGSFAFKKIRSRLAERNKRGTSPDAEEILTCSLELYRSLKQGDSSITQKSDELRTLLENLK